MAGFAPSPKDGIPPHKSSKVCLERYMRCWRSGTWRRSMRLEPPPMDWESSFCERTTSQRFSEPCIGRSEIWSCRCHLSDLGQPARVQFSISQKSYGLFVDRSASGCRSAARSGKRRYAQTSDNRATSPARMCPVCLEFQVEARGRRIVLQTPLRHDDRNIFRSNVVA